MKRKLIGMLTLFLVLVAQSILAQEKTISGTVTDNNGLPLPGVNVVIKNTSTGTQTDFDGKYAISANEGDVLTFSYLGFANQNITVSSSDQINVQLEPDAAVLDEVVVTALGIERDKKSLGYSTQAVAGEEVTKVTTTNFMNSLSGKVAGLNVRSTGTLGGSSNIVVRGYASITGNNQALFVIDGTPIINETNNTNDQRRGRGGYDYGNAAQDINPNDIASINILKGAAATALYGARGANGVIIIETKKGQKKEGLGISVSSTLTLSTADNSTLPKYQNQYGAGYGAFYESDDGYFNLRDIDGDGNLDETVPFTEDASFGARFDPNRLVYQWNSIYPQLPGYQQPTPWVAAENTPADIWNTGVTTINSFALDGGTEKSSFRLGFTNLLQEGALPNSSVKRNTIIFSGTHEFSDKLRASSNITYARTDGKGRYGTGYDANNIMQFSRQWWQVNVDTREQRDAYFATRENITWNVNAFNNRTPIYFDNPYWTLYENFQTDNRNRYFGNFNLNYKINDVFGLLGRFSFDTYDELREERTNVGSVNVPNYTRRNNRLAEFNYDFILNFNKDIFPDFNLDGNIGFNLRRNYDERITVSTNGGLSVPRFYSLANSKDPLQPPFEYESTRMLDGIYARTSFGYKNTYFIEGTIRRDRSSTLPKENNTFWYPSVSGSILLSSLIDEDWLGFAKLRANYAEVGNDTDPYRVFNTYFVSTPYDGNAIASNNNALNNLNLKPERSKSYEFGLEGRFFENRIGFDVSYYNTDTEDQITPVPISTATGFVEKLLNAGTINNKGVEVLLTLNPIRLENFNWNVTANWSTNESEVIKLIDGIENLELASFQGGVSINAAPGKPYGAIRGSDYVYDDDGNKIIGSNGYYLLSETNNQIIGNIQPDWIGGLQNSFSYKNITLDFLIDIQKGGDVFSLDTWYGYATGIYDQSVFLNDLGNPVRNPITDGSDSGGVILDGVTENGEVNMTRAGFTNFANPYGYFRNANKGHVYDASFVKLREVSLTYKFGEDLLDVIPFESGSISLIGRNLWIIDKNVPYSDPEAGLSSGNFQGYQSGAYPNFREFGANLKFNF